MDYFGGVERDLRKAVARGTHEPWHARLRRRRGRPLAVVLVGLVVGGSALAASGVFPIGSPVNAGRVNPRAAAGAPAPGGTHLLSLTVPDPSGGLPWGARVVHTTRGLTCLQIARVQDGQLGVLGIDGAFHDDGRFHPLPADALPTAGRGGMAGGLSFGQRQGTLCMLPGEAFSGDEIGVDRGAGGTLATAHKPRTWLRDIYYGMLGARALNITYRIDGATHVQDVAPGVGAYLIVRPTTATDAVATGGGGISSTGSITPSKPLTAIAYRVRGGICENRIDRISHHCAAPETLFPRSGAPRGAIKQQTPSARLHIAHGVVRSASVTFTAPLAVEGAAEDYSLELPMQACHKAGGGYSGRTTERDIRAGERVTITIFDPFDVCRRTKTITVYFEHVGEPRERVGAVEVTMPPGTGPGPDHSFRLPLHRPIIR